jgi:succinate dehydrogenase flavin-adding protein (antitoxin of CptAB toxin-antitoxin module)
MDTRKKRSLLVEKLSRLHSGMASFNKSDESYDQCLKRLTVFAENSDAESVKVLYRILYALPNIAKDTKRETYFSFIENLNTELINMGFSTEELDEDLTQNEQEVADLFVAENIGKNLKLVEYLNSTFFTESQKTSLGKSRILIDLIKRCKTSYDPDTDKLNDDDFGISYEDFEDALKSLEESKRILIYRAARGIDEEYLDRGLLSFIRTSIINTQVDDSEMDSRIMSDEEKVIEKLVVGDKLFKPTQSQQTFARPSRSVETSFEGIFWAFALLAFAVVLMFLINNA